MAGGIRRLEMQAPTGETVRSPGPLFVTTCRLRQRNRLLDSCPAAGGEAFEPDQPGDDQRGIRLVENGPIVRDKPRPLGDRDIGHMTPVVIRCRISKRDDGTNAARCPQEPASTVRGALIFLQMQIDTLPDAASGAKPAVRAGDALCQDVVTNGGLGRDDGRDAGEGYI